MATLLIVEDDRKTNEAICEYLKLAGHKLIPAYDGESALQCFSNSRIDLIVLDIMLPKISGLSVLHEIREKSSVPILMLTAIGDEYTQVSSFDGQADDYIVKPFELEILLLRISALLRRTGNVSGQYMSCGSILLDKNRMMVLCGGEQADLSQSEYQLLLYLLQNKGRTVTREKLLENIWDINGNYVNDNTLTVTIKRLRKKLHQPECLKTVRSIGYRMEDKI